MFVYLSVCYRIFGEDPPTPASISIRWNLDKKEVVMFSCVLIGRNTNFYSTQFAIRLLNLTISAQDKDISSPFQICGIVVPKLVRKCHAHINCQGCKSFLIFHRWLTQMFISQWYINFYKTTAVDEISKFVCS